MQMLPCESVVWGKLSYPAQCSLLAVDFWYNEPPRACDCPSVINNNQTQRGGDWMCRSALVSRVSSQPIWVLSALLILVKAVISARCTGASFVRSSFDPLRSRDTSPSRNMLNGFMYHPPPSLIASSPLTIYDYNSCCYLLKRAIVVPAR